MNVCVYALLEKQELVCKFCEWIVLEVILKIYFTVKNFFLIAFCNDKTFFILESLIKH